MVFILSKLYGLMPNFVKNNSKVIHMVQTFNNHNKLKELETHYKMLDLIFSSCDIKATGVMREIQLLLLELLRLFDNICAKHDIDYWLDYGTLLGATRHGGFVPWDDDLDIGMLREDYDKFIRVFPEEINNIPEIKDNIIISKLTRPHENFPEDANVLDILNEGTFILFFQCAYKRPYIHFDVFPKDYIEDEGLTEKRNEVQQKLQVELRDKIASGQWTFDEGLEIQSKKMKFTKTKTNQLSDAIDGLHNNICNRIYPADYIFPLDKIEFEGYEFKSPNNVEDYLPLIYGPEYIHIPHIALDHNTTNFVKSQYSNMKELKEDFEKERLKLKTINDIFKT